MKFFFKEFLAFWIDFLFFSFEFALYFSYFSCQELTAIRSKNLNFFFFLLLFSSWWILSSRKSNSDIHNEFLISFEEEKENLFHFQVEINFHCFFFFLSRRWWNWPRRVYGKKWKGRWMWKFIERNLFLSRKKKMK